MGLVLGMTYLPLNLSWWGNTTLGCYCFHFYFRDQMTAWTQSISQALVWDSTGLILLFVIVGMCVTITTFLGPAGHYFLLTPTLLYANVKKSLTSQRRVRDACLCSKASPEPSRSQE